MQLDAVLEASVAVKALHRPWFIDSSLDTTCAMDRLPHRRQFRCMPVTATITKPHGALRVRENYCARVRRAPSPELQP